MTVVCMMTCLYIWHPCHGGATKQDNAYLVGSSLYLVSKIENMN